MADNSSDIDWATVGPPPDDGHGHDSHKGDLSTIGPQTVGVCWMLVVLSALLLSARLWVKFASRGRMWWDDHFLVASWLMLVAYVITTTYAVVGAGLGTHDGSGLNDMSAIQLLIAVSTVFSSLGASWSKTSFAMTLVRITDGWIRTLVWVIVITLNLVLTLNAIMPFIWCSPSSRGWSPQVRGTCWDRKIVIDYYIFGAAYSAAMDFILAMIPWSIIMKLNMAFKEKLGVAVCMSLAAVAGATSIVRGVNVHLLYEEDYTFESAKLSIWTAAEVAVTIMAASIPVLRILVRNYVTRRSEYSRSRSNGTFPGGTNITSITAGSRRQTFRRSANSSGGDLGDGDSGKDLELPLQDPLHIVKFETVRVDYARRTPSQRSNVDQYGFEMAYVPPKRHSGGSMI